MFFAQQRLPDPATFMPQSRDEIAAHNMAAMNALKPFGVQSLFQRRNRLVQQIAAAIGMQPHIIPFGLNPFNIRDSDPNKLRTVGHPKFMRVTTVRFCRNLGHMRLGVGCASCPHDRTAKTFARHRFQHIVHDVEVKRLNREIIISRDQDDCGSFRH